MGRSEIRFGAGATATGAGALSSFNPSATSSSAAHTASTRTRTRGGAGSSTHTSGGGAQYSSRGGTSNHTAAIAEERSKEQPSSFYEDGVNVYDSSDDEHENMNNHNDDEEDSINPPIPKRSSVLEREDPYAYLNNPEVMSRNQQDMNGAESMGSSGGKVCTGYDDEIASSGSSAGPYLDDISEPSSSGSHSGAILRDNRSSSCSPQVARLQDAAFALAPTWLVPTLRAYFWGSAADLESQW